jgi:hypothetical protein
MNESVNKKYTYKHVWYIGALCYKWGGRGFESRWDNLIFQLAQSFQPHYGPGIDATSNRNEYHKSSWGVKSGRLLSVTNSSPSCKLGSIYEKRKSSLRSKYEYQNFWSVKTCNLADKYNFCTLKMEAALSIFTTQIVTFENISCRFQYFPACLISPPRRWKRIVPPKRLAPSKVHRVITQGTPTLYSHRRENLKPSS